MRPVNLVDPDRIKVFKHQEVTQVWLFLGFFRLINVSSKHGLLESLLHNEVLRYLSE